MLARTFILGRYINLNVKTDEATIGVLCSTYEGFPVTLLEYGLVRLPVISSNVGYCSEVIKHEQTGLLFQSNNENDLMQQLFSLIKNESLRNQYAIALHQLVIDKYSQQGVIKELMCIYKEVNG